MRFQIDVNKCLAATAYLMQKAGGRLDVFVLLKTLYLADRTALVEFGRTITGDNFCSMDNGPVLTAVYDLIKGSGEASLQKRWSAHFSRREGHNVRLISAPEIGYLSERDRDVLDRAFELISAVPPFKLAKWTHDQFPEWQNPHGSSIPIDPNIILRSAGISEGAISEIEDEVSNLNFLRTVIA